MPQIDNLAELFAALGQRQALIELGVLVGCGALAWGVAALARRRGHGGFWFGHGGFRGLVPPLLALALAWSASHLLRGLLPIAVFKLAVPLLASLALIRTVVQVLHVAFPRSVLMRTVERTLSWLVWAGLVLWITGVLPKLLDELEQIHWKIGGSNVSMRTLLEGTLAAAVVLVGMLWLSATIESRLMKASSVHLSVRKMAANATRAVLLLVGLLMALSAAGIPLGALSVFGGAIGVGLGFGLQKLAANYVSGFVILAERSLRIGDVVKVDNFEGRITDITTRYTVLRAPNGRESIVPNEMMVSQRVENSSLADPRIALTTVVLVAYGTDLARLAPLLTAAVAKVTRVVPDPAPAMQLSNFAADGLELTCVFWIADPENGQGNVRSEVNLAILAALDEAAVEIPFPQRVMHAVPGRFGPAADA